MNRVQRMLPLLLFPVFILACASGGGKMSLAEMGEKGIKLNYNPKAGSSARYQMSSDQKVSQEIMGQEQHFSTNSKNVVNMTVSSVSSNSISYSLDYESLDVTSNMPNAPNMDSFKSKLLNAKINIDSDKLGNVSKITGLEELKETSLGANLEVSLKNIFPIFSYDELKIGDSWTKDTKESVTSGPLEITIVNKTTYTLTGIEQAQSRECFKIDYETKTTLSGSGNQSGADLTYDGVGKETGEIFFDYNDGIVVSQSSSQSSEGVVVVVAQGMDIPTSTSEVSKRVLIK